MAVDVRLPPLYPDVQLPLAPAVRLPLDPAVQLPPNLVVAEPQASDCHSSLGLTALFFILYGCILGLITGFNNQMHLVYENEY